MKKHDDIIRQKEAMAQETLKIADEALGYMQDALPDAGIRDLISIFNSAMKVHRELVGDIVDLTSPVEGESEKNLAREYSPKVDELLKRFSG